MVHLFAAWTLLNYLFDACCSLAEVQLQEINSNIDLSSIPLPQAETRAAEAEMLVSQLQTEVDRLEGRKPCGSLEDSVFQLFSPDEEHAICVLILLALVVECCSFLFIIYFTKHSASCLAWVFFYEKRESSLGFKEVKFLYRNRLMKRAWNVERSR